LRRKAEITDDYWFAGHYPLFGIPKRTVFRKLDLRIETDTFYEMCYSKNHII
jgi:hypothetical protein